MLMVVASSSVAVPPVAGPPVVLNRATKGIVAGEGIGKKGQYGVSGIIPGVHPFACRAFARVHTPCPPLSPTLPADVPRYAAAIRTHPCL